MITGISGWKGSHLRDASGNNGADANTAKRSLQLARCKSNVHGSVLQLSKLRSPPSSRPVGTRRRNAKCIAALTSSLAAPLASLLPATTPWGIWAALAVAAAGGFWSERTRLGRELSGAPSSRQSTLLLQVRIKRLPTARSTDGWDTLGFCTPCPPPSMGGDSVTPLFT